MYKTKMKLRQHLEILVVLSFMDLKLKYQNSILGFFWSFIKPLLQFLVYFTIFGVVLKISNDANYALKLFFGVLVWAWFAESTNLGLNAFIGKRSIISKIHTNKLLPPLAAYLTPTMNFILNFLVFLAAYIIFVKDTPPHIITLSNAFVFSGSILLISIVMISLNLMLASVNVLYRDMQPIWELILTYGVFLTPIIYQLPIPQRFETLYYSVNVLAFPLQNLKAVFFTSQPFIYSNISITTSYLIVVFFLFVCSILIHRHLSNKIVDFL